VVHREGLRLMGSQGKRLGHGAPGRRQWRTAAARVETRVRAGSDRGEFIRALKVG
jgi:hypothetical protein